MGQRQGSCITFCGFLLPPMWHFCTVMVKLVFKSHAAVSLGIPAGWGRGACLSSFSCWEKHSGKSNLREKGFILPRVSGGSQGSRRLEQQVTGIQSQEKGPSTHRAQFPFCTLCRAGFHSGDDQVKMSLPHQLTEPTPSPEGLHFPR